MNEQELAAYVDFYLDNLKSGKKIEDSIHSLMDVVPEATVLLLQRYSALDKEDVREALLEVFKGTFSSVSSESQQMEILDLLGRELLSDNPRIWKQALDGLSIAKNDAALTHLKLALDQAVKAKDEKKEIWIREVLRDRN